jgi:asparagine synthase (glutamine-hydrolysing)
MAVARHRGPDGTGLETFVEDGDGCAPAHQGGLGLAHARLSIVDLSQGGHQPMCEAQRRFWITYNGEIYNYLELRSELEACGHVFASSSDTEVLLRAYAHWGSACLERLNGIFAFVVVDTQTGRLFAARDRFGVKPLYFWHGPGGLFAVASEIKQFTVLPGWQPRLNGARAYDFLNWNLSDHTQQTLFAGVMQLRGGECLDASFQELRGAAARPRRWYTLKPDAHAAQASWPEATQRFAQLFEDSIRLQLRADVPVGSCLSGGLDSSSVVCVASRMLREAGGGSQHTFSARSDVPAYDEGRFIEAVRGASSVVGHETTPSDEDVFALLPRITWHQDEPFGSTSIHAQWQVCALARSAAVKVLLDGQGADEILAGYHGFFGPRLASLLRSGRWGTLASEVRALRRLHGYGATHSLARMADAMLPDGLRQRLRRTVGKAAVGGAPWLNLNRLGATAQDPFVALGGRQDSVSAVSRAQVLATNLPMLLHWEDRNSMAHGVEARVPFLDHRLVEFALGLPDDYKIAGGVTKRVLREAMTGVLPEQVRTRMDKLGFVTPEEVWTRRTAAQRFRQELVAAVHASQGVLDTGVIAAFDDMVAGRRPFSHVWWRVISFGAWVRAFGVSI